MDQVTAITHGVAHYTPIDEAPPFTVVSCAYADEAHESIAVVTKERGAILLSKRDRPEEWMAALAQMRPEPYVVTLVDEQARLCADIDAHASELRRQHLPSDPGMAWVYREKADEAFRYLGKRELQQGVADGEFPYLEAAVGFDGQTVEEAARAILDRYQAAAASLATLEIYRRRNKQAVMAADTVVDARAAAAGASW